MNKDTTEFAAAQAAHRAAPMARAGRMIVCLLTLGMIYPNAFSESVNIEAYDAENAEKNAAQSKRQ